MCRNRSRAGGEASARSLRSDHLYQLFAYLTNHARSYPAEPPALGVLLYATAAATFGYRYDVHGHLLWVSSVTSRSRGRPSVRARTVSLNPFRGRRGRTRGL